MTALEMYTDDLFIGGQWVKSGSGAFIDVTDPATEEIWAKVPAADEADINKAVAAASAAFRGKGWRDISAHERANYMRKLADEFESRAEALAQIITSENGTPISETRLAAGHGAGLLRYYAGLADFVEKKDSRPYPDRPGHYTEVHRHPRGVCALIAPWNYPVALVMIKLAPALIAGCTVVIKPASETPLDLRILMEASVAAGLPEGVINLVTCTRHTVGALVEHPDVAKVAFTGSTEVGRFLAEQCGRLLKPVTLELGGKSASIVLEDADLEYFGKMVTRTSLRNTGQTCYNATRILAPRSRYDEVVDAVATAVKNSQQGDPFNESTVFGPSASKKQYDTVTNYIKIGQEEGASVATGGSGRPEGLDRGYFAKPTVFANVDNSMRVAQEEIFGPVLVVVPYENEQDAVRIANQSPYGLGGNIFTTDTDHGAELAAQIETGSMGINFYASNLAAPFGGWKDSGLGMEYGPEGINAYTRLQSIHRIGEPK
ncbi:aldehyde dehydrogenase [Aurantimicrobium minutum]|uniref:aldehyde dehydrogenase n=1 Tax=Aurantimicrobium minutum TaxID=708131 RepID=UPI002474DBED|nr:aldehyde dehydrogenase [Aurantimicrobium minutum]MDH6423053.1 aldehyde dehydrogenase (NAD+) [Aurantimicrobium minutum]